jgi:hypothetical protein
MSSGIRRAMPKLPIAKADALRNVDFVRKTALPFYRGHRPRGWRAPLEGVKSLRGSLAALAPEIAATTRGTSDN